MNTFLSRIFIIALLPFASMTLRAGSESVTCQSSERQTALLELYTSEGCSSCPPAERWLSGLKDSPALWKEFVPLAFHVDYWNHLGWRDAWSSPEFTKRQNAYAQLWQTETIYTPEFVLNGSEWRGGWMTRTIPAPTDVKVGVLMAKRAGTNRWEVSFAPVHADASGYEVNVALLESELSSDVKAGENRGRKLIHDFAVVKLTKATLSLHSGAWRGELLLPPPLKAPTGRLALAFWITRVGQMQPIQATGCWLPSATAFAGTTTTPQK